MYTSARPAQEAKLCAYPRMLPSAARAQVQLLLTAWRHQAASRQRRQQGLTACMLLHPQAVHPGPARCHKPVHEQVFAQNRLHPLERTRSSNASLSPRCRGVRSKLRTVKCC